MNFGKKEEDLAEPSSRAPSANHAECGIQHEGEKK